MPWRARPALVRAARRSLLAGLAVVLAPSTSSAAEEAPPASDRAPRRREITLGLGYGPIVLPRPIANYDSATAPTSESSFTGWMLEVTGRRFAKFEYGLLAWSTGGSSDGKGSYAHVLLRFAVEARWLPWGFGRVEPWIGAEFGGAAADDYVVWDETETERAHAASVARFGYGAGFDAGVRGRLSEFFAVNLRGGLLYLSVPRARAVSEPGDTKGVYVVYPTDYGRRLWYSATLSVEVTIPD